MQLTQLVLSGAVTLSMVAAINGPVINPKMVSNQGPPGIERPHVMGSEWGPPGGYRPYDRVVKEPSRHRFHPHEDTGIKNMHDSFHAPTIVARGNEAEKKLKNVPLVSGDPPWVGNYLRPALEPVPKWAQKETGFPHRMKVPKVEKIHAREEYPDRSARYDEWHKKHEEEEHMKKEQPLKSLDESHHHHAREAEADPYADADPESYAEAEAEAVEVEGYLYGRDLTDEEHRKHEGSWMEHPYKRYHREDHHETHHHNTREANAEPYADPESYADANADADAEAYDSAEIHYLYPRGFDHWEDSAAWEIRKRF
ncbi:hypothetical protein MMC17_001656 [Xylographa soralifera]|nr:hypothetical protein [Xylographa soralifera]